MKKLIIGTLLLTSFIFTNEAFSQTGQQIIKRSEDAIRGNTTIAIYAITIKTRRWERTMVLRAWDNRHQRKSFSEIISPKRDAGNRFLMIKDLMYHYDPGLQKSYKIAPSAMLQSWMGSDFSNDDIVKESSIVEDYFHKLKGQKKINGHQCYRVILTPKPQAAVVWGKVVYYARTKDYLPVRQEYYSQKGVLKRFMTYSNFRKMYNRVVPTRYKMQTVRKKNRYTILEVKRVKYNVGISGRTFSFQNLKRR